LHGGNPRIPSRGVQILCSAYQVSAIPRAAKVCRYPQQGELASPAAPQEALRMPRRLPATCCSAATSSSIPGPRNSPPRPCRPPAAPAYSRPHLRGRCRVLDSGGTAYGNDQDQQFDVQGPCDSANKPARTGNVSSGGLPPQFVGDFCLLAVPQSLKLGQARAGCPGAGTRVLPFRKSLHTARSRTRMPIRVPVQSAPWGLSGLLPVTAAAAGPGRIAFVLLALSAEMERAPGRPGTPR
jgi:hypothetical protein